MTDPKTDPNSESVRQFTVAADDEGVRLDRWFKRHLPQIGFATVSRWARTGQIRVDGKRAKPEDRLATGQVLRVPPGGDVPRAKAAPRRARTSPEDRSRRPRRWCWCRTARRSCSTSRRASPRRAAPRPPRMSTACSMRSWAKATRARGWSTGSTRIPRACCWWRARPAARRSSPAVLRAQRQEGLLGAGRRRARRGATG